MQKFLLLEFELQYCDSWHLKCSSHAKYSSCLNVRVALCSVYMEYRVGNGNDDVLVLESLRPVINHKCSARSIYATQSTVHDTLFSNLEHRALKQTVLNVLFLSHTMFSSLHEKGVKVAWAVTTFNAFSQCLLHPLPFFP